MNIVLSKFRSLSLVRRLIILSAITGLFAAVLGAIIQSLIYRNELQLELEQRIQHTYQLINTELQEAITHANHHKLNTILERIAQLPMMDRASITLHDPKREWALSQNNPNSHLYLGSSREFTFEFDNTTPLATLTLSAHRDPYFQKSSLSLQLSIAGNLLVIITLCFSMLYFVKKLIFRHLQNIAAYTSHMSMDNLEEPLRLHRSEARTTHDELDHVVDAIEEMRGQLIEDLDQRRAIELALIAEKEEKLETQKLIENAKASDRAKSQFIATMSHEIRTPMNGVIGMVEMLRCTQLDKEQTHYLDVIARSGDSLMGIINDILDYSKIEAGRMSLENIELDLVEIVNDCLELFGGTAHVRNLELMGNISANTPSKLVGDPTRLRQVLVNLLGNAFKFTSSGGIFIEVSLISDTRSSVITLHFSVTDTGIGIAPDSQTAIFDAFRQADNTTTRKYGGTGLGLAICKQLVELMGGQIGLDSELGHGSTFWFTSKLSIADLENTQPQSCSLALSNKSLYYVNSNDYMDDALQSHADAHNLNLEIIRDGEQALQDLKSPGCKANFILVSQGIAGMSGIELAKSIREIDRYFETPILMLTNEQSSSFTLEDLMPVSSLLKRPLCIHQIIEALLSETAGISLSQLMPTSAPDTPKQVNLEVLVAEDNIVNRMVIEGLLNKLDIQPDFCENGKITVELFCSKQKKYDLILMDCEMPEMDGFEATLHIRKWESDRGYPHIPIIALTAHVEPEHRQRVIDVGMNYYVSKPVTLNKITEALSSVGLN